MPRALQIGNSSLLAATDKRRPTRISDRSHVYRVHPALERPFCGDIWADGPLSISLLMMIAICKTIFRRTSPLSEFRFSLWRPRC